MAFGNIPPSLWPTEELLKVYTLNSDEMVRRMALDALQKRFPYLGADHRMTVEGILKKARGSE